MRRYYSIGRANKILMERFGVCKRTAREYRNTPDYGFPPRIGPTKRLYDAAKFDAAVERFEREFYAG